MKRTSTWIVAVTLALLARTVAADVPQLLNYQGRLTDPSGNPKNGTFTMQFAVYDAESGGNQLPSGTPWSETQSVTVSNGIFNVLLGSVTPLPTNLFEGGPSDAAGPLRFLQVTVSGEALVPRRRISSAAYAIQANRDISARAYNSADIPIPSYGTCPSCSSNVLPFNSERWDTDNIHDATAGSDCSVVPNNCRLTAKTSGKYFIYGHIRWEASAAGTYRILDVRVNGSGGNVIASAIAAPTASANAIDQNVATHFELQAGEFVVLMANQDSGGTLNITQFGQKNSPEFGMVKLP